MFSLYCVSLFFFLFRFFFFRPPSQLVLISFFYAFYFPPPLILMHTSPPPSPHSLIFPRTLSFIAFMSHFTIRPGLRVLHTITLCCSMVDTLIKSSWLNATRIGYWKQQIPHLSGHYALMYEISTDTLYFCADEWDSVSLQRVHCFFFFVTISILGSSPFYGWKSLPPKFNVNNTWLKYVL